jgi:hypothetical protein
LSDQAQSREPRGQLMRWMAKEKKVSVRRGNLSGPGPASASLSFVLYGPTG